MQRILHDVLDGRVCRSNQPHLLEKFCRTFDEDMYRPSAVVACVTTCTSPMTAEALDIPSITSTIRR